MDQRTHFDQPTHWFLTLHLIILISQTLLSCSKQIHPESKKKDEVYLSSMMIEGATFSIPETQQIEFITAKLEPRKLNKAIPTILNLNEQQSEVKAQGQRGACTYFAITSLIENVIKRDTGIELDLSEEYIAWSAKAKSGLRANEEDSSVAVNAKALQQNGFLLENEMPYQASWFEPGGICEGNRKLKGNALECYAHKPPEPLSLKKVRSGNFFIFKEVNSKVYDIVTAISENKAAITVSILGHPEMWLKSQTTGNLELTEKHKQECMTKVTKCSGHAALITGYDLNRKIFFMKNSWGKDWGRKGYGSITFNYIEQMSDRKFMTLQLKKSPNTLRDLIKSIQIK